MLSKQLVNAHKILGLPLTFRFDDHESTVHQDCRNFQTFYIKIIIISKIKALLRQIVLLFAFIYVSFNR